MSVQFSTDTGRDVPSVTAEQMRVVDRIAIDECGPNLFQMMENAGRSLASRVIERLHGCPPGATVTVLAGSGGNGGGGICTARHLANHGLDVQLCLASPARLGVVPAWQLHVFRSTDGREIPADEIESAACDLVVDALIGYGLNAAPTGTTARLISWANACAAPIVALDVPSGIDATTGSAPGQAIVPAETMTLALPKTGLGCGGAGDVVLADIGIPIAVYRKAGIPYESVFEGRPTVALRGGQ